MRNKKLQWTLHLLLLLVVLTVAISLSLTMGEVSIPIKKLPQLFTQKESMEYGVLFYIRIPRTLLGVAVGGSLALAGAIVQGV